MEGSGKDPEESGKGRSCDRDSRSRSGIPGQTQQPQKIRIFWGIKAFRCQPTAAFPWECGGRGQGASPAAGSGIPALSRGRIHGIILLFLPREKTGGKTMTEATPRLQIPNWGLEMIPSQPLPRSWNSDGLQVWSSGIGIHLDPGQGIAALPLPGGAPWVECQGLEQPGWNSGVGSTSNLKKRGNLGEVMNFQSSPPRIPEGIKESHPSTAVLG